MNNVNANTVLALVIFIRVAQAVDPLDTGTWANPSPTGNNLSAVSYGNGRFVAVGWNGTILMSVDGIDWVQQPSGIQDSLTGIVYGNGKFVAVGSTIWNSSDGVNWVKRFSGDVGSIFLSDVAFGNDLFVAVGGYGTVLTSADGENWVRQDVGLGLQSWPSAVAYVN